MGRSRSRSPPRRERRRSRSTSRERERRRRERERSRSRDRDRRRSRSRSPHRRRSRSPPRRHRSSSLSPPGEKEEKQVKTIQISEEDMQGKTEEEIEMMKTMGFSTFDSSKGRKTDGSVNAHAINVSQKRKYRQYMNRKGGFNRPLDFIA